MGTAIGSEVFTIEFGALPKEKTRFYVASFEGTEGLNALFEFKIAVLCKKADIDTEALVGTNAKFTIHRAGGEDAVFCGYVSNIEQKGLISGYCYYIVTLTPSFGKLKLIVNSAVYLEKDLKETIESILGNDKFFTVEHEYRFSGKYPKKEFAMQFEETTFDYIKWRLEEQGAYFYFDSSGERVIFADNGRAHDSSRGTVFYSPSTGLEVNVFDEVIQSFKLKQSTLPSRVVVRTYDWKNPNEPLVGIAEVSKNGAGDVYLTNEEAESKGEAERIAMIRAEQIIAGSRIFTGSGSVPFFRPGVVFTLAKHRAKKFNRDYIITKIRHEGRQETLLNFVCKIPIDSGDNKLSYQNTFECIESDRNYRPMRTVQRKAVYGSIHAFIDGDSSGNLLIDNFGRYKALFPFDSSGRGDGRASCWIRRAQEQVGKDCGLAFPLSAGTEVLVSFVDGNPDQPIITGALANAETGSISGSGNSDSSGIRTDGGPQLTFNNKKNLIQLSNLAGGELMFGSGSEDYMRERDHIIFEGSAVGGTALSGAVFDNICGFISRAYAECSKRLLYLMGGAAVLGKVGQRVLESVSGMNADTNMPATDWGGKIAKLIPFIRAVQDYTPYNALLSAETKNSFSTLQCFPSVEELLVNFGIMAFGRGVSLISDIFDAEAGKTYDNYPKKNALSHKIWTQITSCLPELAIFMLMLNWRKKMSTKKIGGIMIDAKDKNLNLHAKTYIGFHAERGIFLNTRRTEPEFLADWGSPESPMGSHSRITERDIGKIFSRFHEDPKQVILKYEEKKYEADSQYSLADLLVAGHRNEISDGEDMGRAVNSPDEGGENSFIAADTHLYYKKNNWNIQYSKTSWISYAPSHQFVGNVTLFRAVHLTVENSSINLCTTRGLLDFSLVHKTSRTDQLFKLVLDPLNLVMSFMIRDRKDEALKSANITVEENEIKAERSRKEKRYSQANRLSLTAGKLALSVYKSENQNDNKLSLLQLSDKKAKLASENVIVGGIVFSKGRIRAATGKCLLLGKDQVKIILEEDAKNMKLNNIEGIEEPIRKSSEEEEI